MTPNRAPRAHARMAQSQLPIVLATSRALGVGSWRVGRCQRLLRTTQATGIESSYVSVAIRAAPNNFDPRVGTDEGSARVSQLVYSRLMRIDDRLQVVPNLAVRLDNPDPLTYIAHLRSGVKFHDGHELTARDVVYTFGSFLDPDFVSPYKGAYRPLASVRELSPYSVEFKLKEPFGSFPIQLVFPIVPADSGDSLRTFPIGTGPYRFVRYQVDDLVVLSAFEGYFDGLPQNAGVALRVIPDETMRGLELRNGSVDADRQRCLARHRPPAGQRRPEADAGAGRRLRLSRIQHAGSDPGGQACASRHRLRRQPPGDCRLPAPRVRAARGGRARPDRVGVRTQRAPVRSRRGACEGAARRGRLPRPGWRRSAAASQPDAEDLDR